MSARLSSPCTVPSQLRYTGPTRTEDIMAFRNLKRAMPLAAALALAAVAGGTARAAVEHTQQVSVGMDGKPGNRASAVDVVSADGRYVMFDSDASDLVPHDSNRSPDVFIR